MLAKYIYYGTFKSMPKNTTTLKIKHCCNIVLIPFYNIKIEKKIIQRHMLTLSKGKFESVNNSGDTKEKTDKYRYRNKMHLRYLSQ